MGNPREWIYTKFIFISVTPYIVSNKYKHKTYIFVSTGFRINQTKEMDYPNCWENVTMNRISSYQRSTKNNKNLIPPSHQILRILISLLAEERIKFIYSNSLVFLTWEVGQPASYNAKLLGSKVPTSSLYQDYIHFKRKYKVN